VGELFTCSDNPFVDNAKIATSIDLCVAMALQKFASAESAMTLRRIDPKLAVGFVFTALLWPIAVPGWLIELIVRRWRPGWQFGLISASPYFAAYVAMATALLIQGSGPGLVVAIYLLTALEILGLWISIDIARGVTGFSTRYLNIFGLRRSPGALGRVAMGDGSLYRVICLFILSVYWFGCVGYVYDQYHPGAYAGIEFKDGNAKVLADFIYYSAVTIFTVGYGDILPKDIFARILSVAEMFLGTFIVVFLFGSYVSFRVSKILIAASERPEV
jgi:hypothetical protein